MASDYALPADYDPSKARAGWWNMLSQFARQNELVDSAIAKIKKAIPDITDEELSAIGISTKRSSDERN